MFLLRTRLCSSSVTNYHSCPSLRKCWDTTQKGQATFPSCSSCFPLPHRSHRQPVSHFSGQSGFFLQRSILSDWCFVFLYKILQHVIPLQCKFSLVFLLSILWFWLLQSWWFSMSGTFGSCLVTFYLMDNPPHPLPWVLKRLFEILLYDPTMVFM